MNKPSGIIFDIQRFCTHDGPGIRTAVFMKGCNLHCKWCHNPESLSVKTQILLNPQFCIGCGGCVAVCDKHTFSENGTHSIDRAACNHCGKCSEACPAGALEASGRRADIEEILEDVQKDQLFYTESGGGLTVSGGEPTCQPEFLLALLRAAKEEGLHCCIETNGAGDPAVYREILPYIDLFLFDVKDTDPARLKENTGADLNKVLENLRLIDSLGGKTVLRCIILGDINDNDAHYQALKEIRDSLSNCVGIELLPYHTFGISKAERLDESDRYVTYKVPEKEAIARGKEILGIN